ncbi:class I SAM-dependent methyltransferase [Corynebacterium endometrii]|uniref:Putative methyltransferase n=1 Tax=Corynebacterium endometrii TaxID=2488819 RepID=A0A4P7QKK5_9CORY|nr:class I SAM-dependent methyltransferase [Corynebacterium endometrii]QCB29357.1 putative methyltransferase [Corynebacterium endometrii]
MEHTKAMATLARSVRLLRSFKHEQPRPNIFYGGLAEDTAALISALASDAAVPLHRILDVGGGPGYFAEAFARRGVDYFGVEPDVGEMAAAGITVANAVRGDGTRLPFRDASFDVTYSSNVAEHIPNPWDMGAEMLRVTRPGGLVVMSYTVWLGPFGGHETGLWEHYVGGEFARDRYTKRHGRAPKNVFGESLFDLSCREGLDWARAMGAAGHSIVATFPRYHPSWAWWIVKVPGLRELFTSNLVVVLRKG